MAQRAAGGGAGQDLDARGLVLAHAGGDLGAKLAPDLSVNRLRERLATQEVAERPEPVVDPNTAWWRVENALNTASVILGSDDDAAAQGHLDAFGDTLQNMARVTPGRHRHELEAVAKAFDRARRSRTRADHQAATALRQAARELAYASSEPGGLAVAVLFAVLHLARAAAKWHEQRGHEQQAAAARETLRHVQTGYQQAAEPVLAGLIRRAPRVTTASRFEQDLRAVLSDHADRILTDPAWAALTTTLARAEGAGHNSRYLLATVGTQRELDSADRPAEVLNWRIAAQPNRRVQAARRRGSVGDASSMPAMPRSSHPQQLHFPKPHNPVSKARGQGPFP
ncbi:hypothetical protein GCM10022206_45760 [Streptomyces chiangmaiensis]